MKAGLPGRRMYLEGKAYLNFSGTAYLGMPSNPEFRSLLQKGLDLYPGHYGGSRRSDVGPAVYREAEDQLADWTGAPAVLTVSSGTLAAQLTVKGLEGADFYPAPGSHPAFSGKGIPFSGTYEDWCNWITQAENTRDKRLNVLLVSAVDAIFARKFDLAWLNALPPIRDWLLVIDDSHWLGVGGLHGWGSYAELQSRALPVELLVISSLGKALGVPGGLLLGEEDRLQQLAAHPFFGGASPMPPLFAYALKHAGPLYKVAKGMLLERQAALETSLEPSMSLQSFSGFPVWYCPDNRIAEALKEKGILISSFTYPGGNDPVVSRIVLSAHHSSSDILDLADNLRLISKTVSP